MPFPPSLRLVSCRLHAFAGTKVGDNNVDIGYLRLNNVRIPRRHLMEKRQHVEPDGTYVKHGKPDASAASQRGHYLTMMSARIALVGGAAGSAAPCCCWVSM